MNILEIAKWTSCLIFMKVSAIEPQLTRYFGVHIIDNNVKSLNYSQAVFIVNNVSYFTNTSLISTFHKHVLLHPVNLTVSVIQELIPTLLHHNQMSRRTNN